MMRPDTTRPDTADIPVQILLVEDNAADVELTIEGLRDGKVANELMVVRDGVEAMAYLRGEAPYEGAPRPDLVLLDLNMPRMDGRDVLGEMSADPALAVIPVIVLTTSAADADVLDSYRLSASAYITKPVDFGQFVRVIHSLEDFWLRVVRLPPKDVDA